MKKKVLSMLSVVMLLVMVFSLNSFASSGEGSVIVGKNSAMTQAKTGITRTRKYSYVEVTAQSVCPVGEYDEDTYKYCKTRLYHNTIDNRAISDNVKIKESKLNSITIYEGYLNLKKFDLCFAGNNPDLAAKIFYKYDGK